MPGCVLVSDLVRSSGPVKWIEQRGLSEETWWCGQIKAVLNLVPMCVVFTKPFSDTSWESNNSTQFWYCLPRGSIISSGLGPTRLPRPQLPVSDANTCPGCDLCFCPADYRSEVPTTPSMSSMSLLELVCSQNSENILLTKLLVYYQRYNSRFVKRKRCIGQGTGKAHIISVPSPQIFMYSPTQKLSESQPFEFL